MRAAVLILWIGIVALSSGCGVSEKDYQKVVSERNELQARLSREQEECGLLREEFAALKQENRVLASRLELLEVELRQLRGVPESASTGGKQTLLPAERVYIVKKGDTLYGISRKTGVPLETLKALNGLKGSEIRVGQKLNLSSR